MIRAMKESDWNIVCEIVNENWKEIYNGYVNPELLSPTGCANRECDLINDFASARLKEYVWEENSQTVALLSFGNTADSDKSGAFEIWRIYIAPNFQGIGIGHKLISFAEQAAKEQGYTEIVIWAFKDNCKAITFYQKQGYVLEKEEYLGESYLTVGVRLNKKI